MTEDTNLDMEFENIFFEDESQETEESNETVESDNTVEIEESLEATADTNAEADTISLKHLGKEYPLPLSETKKMADVLGMGTQDLINAFQKGMNYDHMADKIKSYQPILETIDFFAKQNNMTRDHYVSELIKQRDQIAFNKQKEELMSKYPDAEDALLNELVEGRLSQQKQKEAEALKEKERQESQKRQDVWVDFFRKFPDLKPDTIPKEVYERANSGENPIISMLEIKNNELKLAAAMVKQNIQAKEKDPGTLAGGGDADADLFMSGFNSI